MPLIVRETDTGLVMENQHLAVTFQQGSPFIEVYDRRVDFTWKQAPETSLRVREYVSTKDSVTAYMSTGAGLELLVTWELAQDLPELHLRMSPEQETRFDVFDFPAPFLLDTGFHTIPHSQGILYPVDDRPLQHFLKDQVLDAYTSDLSMPWFGSVYLPEGLGVIGILESPQDAGIRFGQYKHSKGSLLTVQPVWRSSKGSMSYARSVRYWFHVDGGYVTQAEVYRNYLEEHGGLDEAGGSIRFAEALKGTCHLNLHIGQLSFADAADICEMFQKLGVKKAIVHLRYWEENPYDAPRLLPPSAGAGGPEGLRQLTETLKHIGYIPGIAAGFRDTYEGFEGFDKTIVVKDSRGAPSYGGLWGVSRVPSMRVCGKRQPKLAKEYLPPALEAGPFESVLLTDSCLDARECYDRRHGMDRAADLEARRELFNLCRQLEILVGAEGAMDFAAPYVDFISGQMSLARFYFIEQAPGPHRFNLDPVLRVPLFNLVHHEYTDVTWHHLDSYLGVEDNGTRALFDLLYGNPPSLTISHPGSMELYGERMAALCSTVARLHEQTAGQPLELHGWLTEDRLVQVSRFKSGLQVVANFSRDPFDLPDGEEVAPGSCKALMG